MPGNRKYQMTYERAEEIRALYGDGKGRFLQKDLAKRFNVPEYVISGIVSNKTYIGKAIIANKSWGEPDVSQTDIAAEIGVSRSAIEQIEKRALKKLRIAFEAAGLSFEDLSTSEQGDPDQ